MEEEILFPGATIGIIGESPNGIMLEQAAHKLGFDVIAYGPNEEAPTLRGADVKVVGTYTDQAKLQDKGPLINNIGALSDICLLFDDNFFTKALLNWL